MDAIDLKQSALYINRELSLLEFNRRVLAQARDPATPLLERLKFMCITSSNLDEFFEVRVAGLKQQAAFGAVPHGPGHLTSAEQLKLVGETAHALVDSQYALLNDELLPALRTGGIRFLRRDEWTAKQSTWVKRFFNRELLPVVSPIGLDPAHPFPRILNKSLNFLVALEGKDAFGRNSGVAIVQAPRSLPRVIAVPPQFTDGEHDFVLLSAIIHAHVDDSFPRHAYAGLLSIPGNPQQRFVRRRRRGRRSETGAARRAFTAPLQRRRATGGC